MAEIAVPKFELELVEIAAPTIKSRTQMWDRAQLKYDWDFFEGTVQEISCLQNSTAEANWIAE